MWQAHNVDPLPVLREPPLCRAHQPLGDNIVRPIPVAFDAPKSCKHFIERIPKHFALQTRHVFQDDSARSVGAQVEYDVFKYGSTALGIVRPVAQPRPGKGLARKTRNVQVAGRCCRRVTDRDVVEEVFGRVALKSDFCTIY